MSRSSVRHLALLLAVPLAAAVVVPAGLASAPAAGAASPSITTVLVTGDASASANNPIFISSGCPTGMVPLGAGITVNGGVDPKLLVVASGPTFAAGDLGTMPNGPAPAPTGWKVTLHNTGTTNHLVTIGVICTTPGGAIGPISAVIASGTASPGAGGVADAQCSGQLQAIGGGVGVADTEAVNDDLVISAPLIGSSHVITLPGTSALSPSGWSGTEFNVAGTQPSNFKVAAICADQSGRKTLSVNWATGNGPTNALCPAGFEVTSVGIDALQSIRVEQLAPTFSGTTLDKEPNSAVGPGTGATGTWVDGATPGATVTATCAESATNQTVTRLSGSDRIATAIAISTDAFPTAGKAGGVVLARSDPGQYADALVGTPLAVKKNGPLLLTPGDSLDSRTQAEITRLLPAGATVYLLGGEAALSAGVASTLSSLGFVVIRYGGTNRFDTAVKVAEALDNPTKIFEATGLNFPDALAAGAAAGVLGGAVLLTEDGTQSPDTATYLAAHATDTRVAVGAQAAGADPAATAVAGTDRFDTAARVADLLPAPVKTFGAALGTNYPDALAGGAHIAAQGGPLLLVNPAAPLPTATQAWLTKHKGTLARGFLYGGGAVVGDDVLGALGTAAF